MSYGKMKKRLAPKKRESSPFNGHGRDHKTTTEWDHIRTLPLGMFHTLKGPVMGHVDNVSSAYVRVYAPACVNYMPPSNIVWLPIAFVERFIDLRQDCFFGVSDIPEVVQKGYLGYFDEFVKGSYQMRPVVVSANIPGDEYRTEIPEAMTQIHVLEVCPACRAEVSNWQAHYPVKLPPDQAHTEPRWICEMDEPSIRDKYPGHTPVRPQDA